MNRLGQTVFAVAVALLITACGTTAGGPGGFPGDAAKQEDMFRKPLLGPSDGEAARNEALFLSLLRKAPTEYETWFRLGNLYANHNRPEEAAAAYERVLLADNSHTRAWHNLSVIRLRQAYASLIQAQLNAGNADETLSKRIDELVEQLAKVSALSDMGKSSQPNNVGRKTP